MQISKKQLFSARINSIIILFLFITLIQSCSHNADNPSGNILNGSGGNTSELLVVTHKTWYNGIIGDTLKSVFASTAPWFAQEEPTYDISRISPKDFDNVYKKQRNILIIVRNENSGEPKLEIKKNVWAKPQIVVKFMIPNEESFAPLLGQYYKQILELFHQNELNRINKSFSITIDKNISSKIDKKFGFTLKIPKGYSIVMDTNEFLWLRTEKRDIEQGIFIYTFPFSDTNQFDSKSIIQKRNEITGKYVPGPTRNSKMVVSKLFPAYHERIMFKNKYAGMVRSWWDIDNYPLGGPFLSYTFTDQENKKIIVLDAFVLAPKKDKRDILIQMEAMFDTFTFSKADETK